MADLPPVDDIGDDPPGAPRWVKVFGLVVAVLVVLFVIVHLVGGGFGHHQLP